MARTTTKKIKSELIGYMNSFAPSNEVRGLAAAIRILEEMEDESSKKQSSKQGSNNCFPEEEYKYNRTVY